MIQFLSIYTLAFRFFQEHKMSIVDFIFKNWRYNGIVRHFIFGIIEFRNI